MQSRIWHLWSARRPARPGRDVFTALALKMALLLAIYLLFFGPNHRMPPDAAATAQALIGAGTPKDIP